jgi:pre-rRNA-processing protein TSR1
MTAAGVLDPAILVRDMLASPNIPVTFDVKRQSHRLSLLIVIPEQPLAALEIMKVADLLLVVTQVQPKANTEEFADFCYKGEMYSDSEIKAVEVDASQAVRSAMLAPTALGLPPVLCALRGLERCSLKMRASLRNTCATAVRECLQLPHDRLRVFPADLDGELLELIRHLAEQMPVQPRWRAQRAYVLVERASLIPEPQSFESSASLYPTTVTIAAEGHVRGTSMSCNQLVHLPGVGDFTLGGIVSASNQFTRRATCTENRRDRSNVIFDPMKKTTGFGLPGTTIFQQQQFPVRENTPGLFGGDQTWPSDEELDAMQGNNATQNLDSCEVRRASWDVMISESCNSDKGRDHDCRQMKSKSKMICKSEEERDRSILLEQTAHFGGDEFTSSQHVAADEFQPQVQLSFQTRESAVTIQHSKTRQSSRAGASDEHFFPDEIETPIDIPARLRFARYRGLKSFRSSLWDTNEQLPVDYERIFTFKNFKRATLLASTEARSQASSGLGIGTFVKLIIRGIPSVAARGLLAGEEACVSSPETVKINCSGVVGRGGVGPSWSGWCGGAGPFVISTLMQHESKLTVMHYGITKTPSCDFPLRSKTPLWFHIGFRRERASPIFSSDGIGDKHKFERFLQHGRPSIASVFGPVVYPPAPVLAFSEKSFASGMPAQLVLSGSVREAAPNRVILKRIVITGVPHKTHKSKAVVRQMFFNPEDVLWFKPLELWTKYGMRGKIKDAVGTHGSMKCQFNGVIQQRDTVCASLYKRVFPKFL